MKINNKVLWLSLALLILVIDQSSKFLVSRFIIPEHFVPVFPGFSFFFTYNVGAAFSFLAEANGWQEWLFSSLAILVSIVIVYWLFFNAPQQGKLVTKLSFMLILGGALGNLIDRILFGHVRDFLYFYWHNFSWPTFNFADSAISIGAVILLIEIFSSKKEKSEEKRTS